MVHGDLRREKEIEIQTRAQSSLDAEDERLAGEVLFWIRLAHDQYNRGDRAGYDISRKKVREIGEFLCSNGGSERMALIAYRVQALANMSGYSTRTRDVELFWDGICGWQW